MRIRLPPKCGISYFNHGKIELNSVKLRSRSRLLATSCISAGTNAGAASTSLSSVQVPSLSSVFALCSNTISSSSSTSNDSYHQSSYRSYSIATGKPSTPDPTQGSPSKNTTTTSSSSSTNNSSNNSNSFATSKEEQEEMDVLLETAYKQAKEISQLAFFRKRQISTNSDNVHNNNNNDRSNSSSTSSSIQPASSGGSIDGPLKARAMEGKKHQQQQRQIISNDTSTKGTKSTKIQTAPDSNNNTTTANNIKTGNVHQKVFHSETKLDIQHEASAAEALLKLTSHSNFQFAFTQKQQQQKQKQQQQIENIDNNNVVLSLHHAFISVIHWLCTTLSTISNDNDNYSHNYETHTKRIVSSSSLSTTATTPPFTPPLPPKESLLLSHILSLSERSRTLDLPLTLPLYELICTLIARHGTSSIGRGHNSQNGHSSQSHSHSHKNQGQLYNDNSNISLLLLDLSTHARDALSTSTSTSTSTSVSKTTQSTVSETKTLTLPSTTNELKIIKASFFANALKELLHKNQIRDMIELFHGMRNIHNIQVVVDLETGMELLALLKDKVDYNIKNGNFREPGNDFDDEDDDDEVEEEEGKDIDINVNSHHNGYDKNGIASFDEADAMELAMILQTPVMEELNMKRKELEEFRLGDDIGTSSIDDGSSSRSHSNSSMLDASRLMDHNNLDRNNEEDLRDDSHDDWDDDITVDDGDDEYQLCDENDNDDSLISSSSGKSFHSSKENDDQDEKNSCDIEEEIQKLNDLVKSMESNDHDATAKEAAQASALAILEKINKSRINDSRSSGIRRSKIEQVEKEWSSVSSEENKEMTKKPLDGLNARLHLNSSTGIIEQVEFTFDPNKSLAKKRMDDTYNEILNDMIYMRDPSWEIPDVIPQLEEWNSNAGLLFSEEYELELVKEITGDDDDNDEDDDGFNSGDHK